MSLRVVPRRFDVAVPHVRTRDFEALGRHEAVEHGGDPLRSGVQNDAEGTRVGPAVGAGGGRGAGGARQTNAECGVRSPEWEGAERGADGPPGPAHAAY